MADYRLLLEEIETLSSKKVILNVYEDSYIGNPLLLSSDFITRSDDNTGCYYLEPFAQWSAARPLDWWTRYTSLKHNRMKNFKSATLQALIMGLAATYIVLTLKNRTDFCTGPYGTAMYDVFFPRYFMFKGRRSDGPVIWQQ